MPAWPLRPAKGSRESVSALVGLTHRYLGTHHGLTVHLERRLLGLHPSELALQLLSTLLDGLALRDVPLERRP